MISHFKFCFVSFLLSGQQQQVDFRRFLADNNCLLWPTNQASSLVVGVNQNRNVVSRAVKELSITIQLSKAEESCSFH